MIKLDDALLEELGLSKLPIVEKPAFLAQVRDTLELRVGHAVSTGLSDEQLDEFDRLAEGDDSGAAATRFLENHCPDYKATVQQIFDALKKEISGAAQAILAASGLVDAS